MVTHILLFEDTTTCTFATVVGDPLEGDSFKMKYVVEVVVTFNREQALKVFDEVSIYMEAEIVDSTKTRLAERDWDITPHPTESLRLTGQAGRWLFGALHNLHARLEEQNEPKERAPVPPPRKPTLN